MRRVVGIHSCLEVFRVRPRAVAKVLLKQGWERSDDLSEFSDLASKNGMKVRTVPVSELDQLSHGHQGVCVEVLEDPIFDWDKVKKQDRSLILGLDGIEDPQNLGAILRAAWVFGVDGVWLPSSRAMGMTPAVAKVASGGAEHIPLDVHSSLLAPIERAKEAGYWVYGLSEKSKKSIWDMKLPEKIVLVIGAEGTGIRKSTLGVCDELVTIPQVYQGTSLNAAVSASIALAETRRQWTHL